MPSSCRRFPAVLALLTAAVLALGAKTAEATTVQDLVRLKGHEMNVLSGMGIVVGLDGTGDSSRDSLAAARPYARLLTNMGNPILDPAELARADAFALVKVTMRIPAAGAREGDRIDVSVEKLMNAESLMGGRLVFSLLRLPVPDAPDLIPMAFAEGPLIVDPLTPGSGTVREGGQLLVDMRTNPVASDSTLTLVLKGPYATYPIAVTLADEINQTFGLTASFSNIARVEDSSNVRISIPREYRDNPAWFISTVLTTPIDAARLRTQARIVINDRAGIITVTGDVEVGPVAVSHEGLRLSTVPAFDPNDPAAIDPATVPRSGRWVGIDTTDRVARRSTRLTDLLTAFDQLNLPTRDQIAIIYELRDTGALHAEIVSR